MSDMHFSLSTISISIEEVHEVLVSLDVLKSPGIDQISPRILQNYADALCEPLHHLFIQSLLQAYLPSSWKVHKVVPVFKAGDANCVKNHHPISLLSMYFIQSP